MFYYSVSSLYCMPTSVYHPGGAGLGTCFGAPNIEKMLKDGGFRNVNLRLKDGASIFICSKD